MLELAVWDRVVRGAAPAYLQGRHADHLVDVIEESGQDVKDGRLREY